MTFSQIPRNLKESRQTICEGMFENFFEQYKAINKLSIADLKDSYIKMQ